MLLKTQLLVFSFISLLSFSQIPGRVSTANYINKRACVYTKPNVYSSVNRSNISAFLKSSNPNLIHSNLIPNFEISSPGGTHFTFDQTFNNIKIFRGCIKVNFNNNGYISSILDNTLPIPSVLATNFTSDVICNKFIDSKKGDLAIDKLVIEPVYFFDGDIWQPYKRIELATPQPSHYEYILDQNGVVVYEQNLIASYKRTNDIDTNVSAKVFLPDPLTRAGVNYGLPYIDGNDSDLVLLNNQRIDTCIKVDFTNDTFRLVSPYVVVKEFSNPVTIPTITTTVAPSFDFTRHQTGFEDVNAFFHITNFHNYIQQLGFINLGNTQIWIDTHALNYQDNSNFLSAYNPVRIAFGQGGVDDAEDADVIIHEYCHALSYSASPNTNSGSERQALDEAHGDYFAASYSKAINPYNSQNVFSWDGHNQYWNGRVVNSNKHYPNDIVNDLYLDAELWSSALMEIHDTLGRTTTDKLVLELMYSYTTNLKMSDAALLLLDADSALFNGIHYPQLCSILSRRGFINACITGINLPVYNAKTLTISGTMEFAQGGFAFIHSSSNQPITINLFDTFGRCIREQLNADPTNLPINSSNLASGIYILKATQGNITNTFKLIRY